MVFLSRHCTRVALGLASVLLAATLTAWLVGRRVDTVWDTAVRPAGPVPFAVSLAAPATPAVVTDPMPPDEPTPSEVVELAAEPPPAPAPGSAPAVPTPPADAGERYALETGPFLSADAADRVEDQLNHLGYATIRFRKQDVRRLYVVTAAGFASAAEARRAAGELGQGVVVQGETGVELVVEQLSTLGAATAAARQARRRGFDVRIDDRPRPVVIYHVRYGQFPSRIGAEVRGEELALLGLVSRVVKIK